MKVKQTIIRSWRMQNASPYGVHLWFDPSVESVYLFSVPTLLRDDVEKKVDLLVDKFGQMNYLGEYSSVSGQAGSSEPVKIPNGNERRSGRNRPSLPSELKEPL